jgi:hypothetical protein
LIGHAASKLFGIAGVLHCVKVSWFGHIEAPAVRFLLWALIVSGDNGLNHGNS